MLKSKLQLGSEMLTYSYHLISMRSSFRYCERYLDEYLDFRIYTFFFRTYTFFDECLVFRGREVALDTFF